jgi:tetratricopeptide (TPR) repeat protein
MLRSTDHERFLKSASAHIIPQRSLTQNAMGLPNADILSSAQSDGESTKQRRQQYNDYLETLSFLLVNDIPASDPHWQTIYEKIIQVFSHNDIFNEPQQNHMILSDLYSAYAHFLKNLIPLQYEQSLSSFEGAITKNPNNNRAYNGLGLLHEKVNQPAKAILAYEKALEIDPNYFSALINYALLLTRRYKENNDFADVRISKMLLDHAEQVEPNHPVILKNQAHFYHAIDQFGYAELYLKRLMELQPEEWESYRLLAEHELLRGNFSKAKRLYLDAEFKAKTELDYATTYFNLSFVCSSLEEYEISKEYAEKALEKNFPNVSWVYLNIIAADLFAEKYLAAYQTIDDVILKFPDNKCHAYLYRILGDILSHLKYYDEAILAYKKAMIMEPELGSKSEIRFRLANVQYDQGKYGEALANYQTVCTESSFEPQMVNAAIRDTQIKVSAKLLALPGVSRSKLNMDAARVSIEQNILRQQLPAHYALQKSKELPKNAFIDDNKVYYRAHMDEFRLSYKTFLLRKQADGKWYRKSRYPGSMTWRLMESSFLYNFVVLYDEQYHRHTIVFGRTGHYYLARKAFRSTRGIPVRYAGGVLIKNGMIQHWNNRSGHYTPSNEQASEEIAIVIGFPIEKFTTQEIMKSKIKNLLKDYGSLGLQYLANNQLRYLAEGDKQIVKSLVSEFSL